MSCRAGVAVTVQMPAARRAAHWAPEPLVAGQPVPFAGQRGDDLGGGQVQQALCGVAGLEYAVRVDAGEGPLRAAGGVLVSAGAGCGDSSLDDITLSNSGRPRRSLAEPPFCTPSTARCMANGGAHIRYSAR